jgi:hypothetical protein
MDAAKNFAKVTVDPSGNYDDNDTSIALLTGDGARLPTAPFNVVWWNATDYPDPSDDPNVEIVRVTAISTDTVTVVRGQEGTAGVEHNVAGKTYKMIAGLTAKTVNEDLVGDVFGSGPALLVDPSAPSITVRKSSVQYIKQDDAVGSLIQTSHGFLGDHDGQGNGSVLDIDDSTSKALFNNLDLATTQAQSASVAVGTLAGKLPVYDAIGGLIGYIPIYSTII